MVACLWDVPICPFSLVYNTGSTKISFCLLQKYLSIPLTLLAIKLRLMLGNMRSMKLRLILNYKILTGNWRTKIFAVTF